jgi:capsid protein
MATVTEKIEALNAELREAVTQYNQTIEAQAVLREKIIATQGAIGALQEFAKDEVLNKLKEVEE